MLPVLRDTQVNKKNVTARTVHDNKVLLSSKACVILSPDTVLVVLAREPFSVTPLDGSCAVSVFGE